MVFILGIIIAATLLLIEFQLFGNWLKAWAQKRWPKLTDVWWHSMLLLLAILSLVVGIIDKMQGDNKTRSIETALDQIKHGVRTVEAEVEVRFQANFVEQVSMNGNATIPDKGAPALFLSFKDSPPTRDEFMSGPSALRLFRNYHTLETKGTNGVVRYRAEMPRDSQFIGESPDFLGKATWFGFTALKDIPPVGNFDSKPNPEYMLESVHVKISVNGNHRYTVANTWTPPRKTHWLDEVLFKLNKENFNLE
jgi:hypothetical protein